MFTGCTVTRGGVLMGYGAKLRIAVRPADVISSAAACAAAAGTVRMPVRM